MADVAKMANMLPLRIIMCQALKSAMFVDYLSVLLYMNVDIAQLDFASVSLYKLINYDSNISIVTTYYIFMIIYVFVGFVHMGA